MAQLAVCTASAAGSVTRVPCRCLPTAHRLPGHQAGLLQTWHTPACVSSSARQLQRLHAASPSVEAPPQPTQKATLPVTVLTGFLGSGKTTLLNHILKVQSTKRIMVIENEFGEISIDSDKMVVARNDTTEIIELPNGCACCDVQAELVDSLHMIAERHREKPYDQLVIETTGMANPLPIMQVFSDPELAEDMTLDGIVTMVDAKHVHKRLDDDVPAGFINEALEQIAYADRIILNKTDLVSEEELQSVEARLRTINEGAQIRRASKASVDVSFVTGLNMQDTQSVVREFQQGPAGTSGHSHEHHSHQEHSHHDPDHSHDHEAHSSTSHSHAEHGNGHASSSSSTTSASTSSSSSSTQSHEHSHDHDHGHDHGHHHHHQHDDAVKSISIQADGDLDELKLQAWLNEMLNSCFMDMFRYKGILAIMGEDGQQLDVVFQGVHDVADFVPIEGEPLAQPRSSRMVFIGKDLPEEKLRSGFQQCLLAS